MSVHAATGATQRSSPLTMKTAVLPAPVAGIDGRLNLSSNNPLNAVYAYNLVPSEYGLRSRLGFREWGINLETAPSAGVGVRTIIPYTGTSGVSSNRLFATTNEGIWDVSVATDAPSLALAFGDTTGDAGWGNFASYTTDAGDELVFYADETNGLFQYSPALDTWAVSTGITGVDPADVVFVVVHKQRIWLVERNTPVAWYLPVASISGEAKKFSFGAKFRHGGDLVGLFNWTIDGGSGVDDYLVAVSRGGDVLPYRGDDPSASFTWEGAGTFFVGRLPAGRRCAAEDGGDLHLLCDTGLISLSDLLKGNIANAEGEEINLKIARFLRTDMEVLSQERGWGINLNPNEGSVLVSTPVRAANGYIQYTYNYAVTGWGQWRDVPGQVFQTWAGGMMVGTADGRVLRMDVTLDNVPYAGGTGGLPVAFSVLQNYTDAGAPGVFKYPKFVRPNFLAQQEVQITTKLLYDYNVSAMLPAPSAPAVSSTDLWDTGLWDGAVWASGDLVNQTVTRGAWGRGRAVAVAMRGECRTRSTLISTDIMWTAAGPF